MHPPGGDLVIHHFHGSVGIFIVHEAGELPQLFYPTYEDALRHAAKIADRLHVDVWSAATPLGGPWERVYRHPLM